MDRNEELREFLSHFRQRIRLYDGWLLLQNALPFALLAAVAVLAAGRLLPIENLLLWAGAPILAGLFGMAGYSLLRPRSLMWAARRVDERAGLKERLSSSLYFMQGGRLDPSDPHQAELIADLHVDALDAARSLEIGKTFAFESQKRPLMAAAGLALACALLMALPNPMAQVIADRRAVAAEAARQAEAIEELEKAVEESQDLTPAEKEELRKQLEELARQLRENPGDMDEALADVSRLEEALRPLLDADSLNSQAGLEDLAARLQELAGMETSKTEPGDLSAAAQALSELAEGAQSASQSQRQETAETLSAMSSRASQSGQSELAQALAALAGAVREGDSEGAQKAASDARKAMADAKSSQARQAMLNKALAQLQKSRQAIAGSCKNPGAGNQAAQGQNPGQGQGQGQGAGGGGGSQANVLPPNTGGAMNLHGPTGSKPVSPADLLGQSIFAPRLQAEGTNGEELQITGQDSGQGQETVTESQTPLPGTGNPALVPYAEVYQEYLDAANQAMDQSYIPEYLKAYVKSYFSQLEP